MKKIVHYRMNNGKYAIINIPEQSQDIQLLSMKDINDLTNWSQDITQRQEQRNVWMSVFSYQNSFNDNLDITAPLYFSKEDDCKNIIEKLLLI